jgi:hypothetical protein
LTDAVFKQLTRFLNVKFAVGQKFPDGERFQLCDLFLKRHLPQKFTHANRHFTHPFLTTPSQSLGSATPSTALTPSFFTSARDFPHDTKRSALF